MPKIYSANNEGLIPSIEYIQTIVKMIENELKSLNVNFNGFKTIDANIEELNTDKNIIPAESIKTDSKHRFVNEALLTTFVSKPSMFQVEQLIENLRKEVENKINESYMKLINTPNVINKLRDIASILYEDSNDANKLISTIAAKATIEQLEEHAASYTHMNNNDRKALNILLKCVTDGFIDWNAEDGEINSLKNKPLALPADGGNADTISNHKINELINKNTEDIIIGRTSKKYSKDSCDLFAADGIINQEDFESTIKSIEYGTVLFKTGEYYINIMDAQYLRKPPVVFSGTHRKLSTIIVKEIINMYNTSFVNIGFKDSNIRINSYTDLNNVEFKNCNIILHKSEECNISNCVFIDCEISIEGPIMNNIIVHNRFINTKPIVYLGSSNIIKENI
jgi:hypothetical protein